MPPQLFLTVQEKQMVVRDPNQGLAFNAVPDHSMFLDWVAEAHWVSQEWRAEGWRDQEMYDGFQWDDTSYNAAIEAGIDPLTINRIFPAVNLILGSQVVNRFNIEAKSRTHADGEMSQIMTEGVQFVMDQWDGKYLVSQAFRDQVIPGVGWISPCYENDPRKERIKIAQRDWKEIFFDPFSSPWLDPTNCRYAFHQRWMNKTELKALFPAHAYEIEQYAGDMSREASSGYSRYWYEDEATKVEEKIRYAGGFGWVTKNTQRVRPVELWYPLMEPAMFACFPDGRVVEIRNNLDPRTLYQLFKAASQIVRCLVRKMRYRTFLGNLVLADGYSPYPHDEFPYIPFIGYIDRWGFPYGIPRQLRGQNEEVNKRRSMALALISSRKIVIEDSAVDEKLGLQGAYEEANKPDGVIVMKPGKKDAITIVEQGQLAPAQINLMAQSEREIQEISGVNAEATGYRSNAITGVAVERRAQYSGMVTAPLFDNLKRSMKMLGSQVVSMIQGGWQGEKVLRITDRLSGAEKFRMLNEISSDSFGNRIVRNDITQGKYDVICVEAPQTDTVREKNMDLMIEWVKKSPPEAAPLLLSIALELSDIPDKGKVLQQIRPLLGLPPGWEDMTEDQIREQMAQNYKAKADKESQMEQVTMNKIMLELQNMQLQNQQIAATIQKILAGAENMSTMAEVKKVKVGQDQQRIDLDREKAAVDARVKGTDADHDAQKLQMEQFTALTDAIVKKNSMEKGIVSTPVGDTSSSNPVANAFSGNPVNPETTGT